MTKTQTIITVLSIGIIVFAATATVHHWSRTALKSGWFWIGFLALWLFWSALICALINNQIEINHLKTEIDKTDKNLKDFLKQE